MTFRSFNYFCINRDFEASHGHPPPTCKISDVKKKDALAREKARNISKSLGPLSREAYFLSVRILDEQMTSLVLQTPVWRCPKNWNFENHVVLHDGLTLGSVISGSRTCDQTVCSTCCSRHGDKKFICFRNKLALWGSHGRTCVTEQWITVSVRQHAFCSVTCEPRLLPVLTG